MDSFTNETVIKALRNAGYKTIMTKNCNFYEIGMPQASEVFRNMSNHTSLSITPKEAKKLKVLEEAIKVIQEGFEQTYIAKLSNIFLKLDKKDLCLSENQLYWVKEILLELEDFVLDPSAGKCTGSWFDIQDLEKFNDELYDYLNKKIKSINTDNINDKNNKKIIELLVNILDINKNKNKQLEQFAIQLKNLQIVQKQDVAAPRFVFDRNNEINRTTLGEAIIRDKQYKGHWIDRTYLNNGNFFDLVSTWLHEISHKAGGDGTPAFAYKLTDMVESILRSSSDSSELQTDLRALEKVFNEI